MKRSFIPILAVFLTLSLIFGGCASQKLKALPEEASPVTTTTATKKPTTTKKPSSASPLPSNVILYPTEEPLTKPEKKENLVNILIIGNSCAYYFMDELEGMARAAGMKVNVYNAY